LAVLVLSFAVKPWLDGGCSWRAPPLSRAFIWLAHG
jgi:hypothetical protein